MNNFESVRNDPASIVLEASLFPDAEDLDALTRQIDRLQIETDKTSIIFPCSLGHQQRRYLHLKATEANLDHFTYTVGENKKYLVLSKTPYELASIDHVGSGGEGEVLRSRRWSVERAREWYDSHSFLVGCNFLPSSAVNQIEMWHESTFDSKTCGKELALAKSLCFNVVRVYLHDLLWKHDREGFIERIKVFLSLASRYGCKVIFVFFDDCHRSNPRYGIQMPPIKGVHNSGWVQSPGKALVMGMAKHLGDSVVREEGGCSLAEVQEGLQYLKEYVQGILTEFGADERVLMWDIYNEPGQNSLNDISNVLLRLAWKWAYEVKDRVTQPMTSCMLGSVGTYNIRTNSIYSDILSFHSYEAGPSLLSLIESYEDKALGRPLICTEFLARERGSTFESCLPVFDRKRVGCICWGLVVGKSQTHFNWTTSENIEEKAKANGYLDLSRDAIPEPKLWFHDLYRRDGTPFKKSEVNFIVKYMYEVLFRNVPNIERASQKK